MTAEPDGVAEQYRREMLGAFAHEVRSPLTSMHMALELARRDSGAGDLRLDAELVAMLTASLGDLQTLADDLQETSRLERGRVTLVPSPCDLAAIATEAGQILRAGLRLEANVEPALDGWWDRARLVRAIAGFAEAVDRMGDGSGEAQMHAARGGQVVVMQFHSGTPGGVARDIALDAGFSYFRSRQFVLAMGGTIALRRAERWAEITVGLPLR